MDTVAPLPLPVTRTPLPLASDARSPPGRVAIVTWRPWTGSADQLTSGTITPDGARIRTASTVRWLVETGRRRSWSGSVTTRPTASSKRVGRKWAIASSRAAAVDGPPRQTRTEVAETGQEREVDDTTAPHAALQDCGRAVGKGRVDPRALGRDPRDRTEHREGAGRAAHGFERARNGRSCFSKPTWRPRAPRASRPPAEAGASRGWGGRTRPGSRPLPLRRRGRRPRPRRRSPVPPPHSRGRSVRNSAR